MNEKKPDAMAKSKPDAELSALSVVLKALAQLDTDARSRVLDYAAAWVDARSTR